MNSKTYVVIGLGIFGSAVAKTIARSGADVIAIDSNINCVENVADVVSNAVQADCCDLDQLREAGVQDADVAIVAMGSHLEESVMAIIHLKELHVKEIIAKANNHNYMYVFERVGATSVIQPEKEAGGRLAKRLLNPNIVDMFNVDHEYSILEIKAPSLWQNHSLIELELRKKYSVNVIGIRNADSKKLSMNFTPDYVIRPDDSLIIVADSRRLQQLDLN